MNPVEEIEDWDDLPELGLDRICLETGYHDMPLSGTCRLKGNKKLVYFLCTQGPMDDNWGYTYFSLPLIARLMWRIGEMIDEDRKENPQYSHHYLRWADTMLPVLEYRKRGWPWLGRPIGRSADIENGEPREYPDLERKAA